MIYLDNNATTKLDSRVLSAMMPFFTDEYANSASNHLFGTRSSQAVQAAREQISDLINCNPTDLIFTSGATEAINLAVKGVAGEYQEKGKHIITCQTEHPAVLDTCRALEDDGYEITYLPVKPNGQIDLEVLRTAISASTILVSIMWVNNETGVIQPIKEISEICHSSGVFFMTDATQAIGKLPVSVNEYGIDLMAFSGHKFYGPKGVGALYVRSRRPFKVKLKAQMHGGGHERDLRSGTLNVPGIVGFAQAAQIAKDEMKENAIRIGALRDELEHQLLSLGQSFINGDRLARLYNVINICFQGVDADAIIAGLKETMLSNGSACSSTKVEPSHVLKSMNLSDEDAYSSLRISLGQFNTKEEIQTAGQEISACIIKLREMKTSLSNT